MGVNFTAMYQLARSGTPLIKYIGGWLLIYQTLIGEKL